MRKLSLLSLSLVMGISAFAQTGRQYVITGEMTNDSCFTSKNVIQKLYLVRTINGKEVNVDSATVRNKQFSFKGTAPDVVDVAFIKGFDNGVVQLFLEPGNIKVHPFDGRFPVGARVSGTTNNDVLNGYQKLNDDFTALLRANKSPLMNSVPKNLTPDDKEFMPYQRAAYYGNKLYLLGDIAKYVHQHADAPASLYIIRYNLFHVFTPKVVERQFLRMLDPKLQSHPMYKEMLNQLAAAKLAVGELSPVFEGQTPDGKAVKLEDLRGNYVLIDFWASWCGPCRREFPYLKQALADSEKFGRFRILSYSIDDKRDKWVNSISANKLEHKNWIHISTLNGWQSDVSKLFNITAIPRTVLLNPEGRIIAFDLRGEELVNKIKNIAEGKEKFE